MTIPVPCPCGNKLRAGDIHAGKRVLCPACGRSLTVPEGKRGAEGAECPRCGKPNSPNTIVCWNCAEPLARPSPLGADTIVQRESAPLCSRAPSYEGRRNRQRARWIASILFLIVGAGFLIWWPNVVFRGTPISFGWLWVVLGILGVFSCLFNVNLAFRGGNLDPDDD